MFQNNYPKQRQVQEHGDCEIEVKNTKSGKKLKISKSCRKENLDAIEKIS